VRAATIFSGTFANGSNLVSNRFEPAPVDGIPRLLKYLGSQKDTNLATEQGIVIKTDSSAAWVKTIKTGACKGCSARGACHSVGNSDQMEVPLIGLPGNPVAAMVAFEVFARPAILKLAGHRSFEKNKLRAVLDEEVTNSGRRHYMRGFVYLKENGYHVTTRGSGVQVQGSGILTSMVWANCLVEVPEKVTYLPADAPVEVWILD